VHAEEKERRGRKEKEKKEKNRREREAVNQNGEKGKRIERGRDKVMCHHVGGWRKMR
jgi:hypothetical protein